MVTVVNCEFVIVQWFNLGTAMEEVIGSVRRRKVEKKGKDKKICGNRPILINFR